MNLKINLEGNLLDEHLLSVENKYSVTRVIINLFRVSGEMQERGYDSGQMYHYFEYNKFIIIISIR